MRFGLALLFLVPSILFAQSRCATEHVFENKNRTETVAKFNTWLQSKVEEKRKYQLTEQANSRILSAYEVPVVFHIIHNGETIGNGTNLSDQRIIEQLEILNDDFLRLNDDRINTPEEFIDVAADTEISFVFAKQDPEGLSSTGITRTEYEQSGFSDSDGELITSIIQWPPEDYINIYVINLIGWIGWANFPFSDLDGLESEIQNFRERDALFIRSNYIGFNDDNTVEFTSYGRTLTHEMGHYLGVLHSHHGGCSSSGDYCNDTPAQSSSNLGWGNCSGTPNTKCDQNENTMFQNFMGYADDECMNLFTLCQKERMQTVLDYSPRRKSLLTSHGLQEPQVVANDVGIIEIRSPLKEDCSSSFIPSIQISNYGSNEVASVEIIVKIDGVIQETNLFNPSLDIGESEVVSFSGIDINTSALSEIEFEITEVNGTVDGKSFNNLKQVLINPTETSIVPYELSFVPEDILLASTEIETQSNWEIVIASDSIALNRAAGVMFYEMSDSIDYGIKDLMYTEVVDVSSLTSAQLTFKYAYSGRTSQEYLDELIVAVSTDCGNTFSSDDYIYSRRGNSLVTTTRTDLSYSPASESDWERVDINITPYLDNDNLQIGFIAVNGGGNNLFVDNIQVTSSNLLAYDLGIRRIDNVSTVTCSDNLSPTLNIRNFGYERITSFELSISLNGVSFVENFENLSIDSGESDEFVLDLDDLTEGKNELFFEILSINETSDEQLDNNDFAYTVNINNSLDTIPIRETFDDGMNGWLISEVNDTPQLALTELTGRNDVIKSTAYDFGTVGAQSFLVSPSLNTSNVKYGAIRFRLSHAIRPNFSDNLKILLSNNCGVDYDIEVYNKNSSDMTTTISNEPWSPEDDEDWTNEFIDISEHMIWNSLRVAMVFTNGQGNDLYIDDIEVLTSNDPNQVIPEFNFLMYPNPADRVFHLSFKLPEKQTVNVRVLDMSGRTVINVDLEDVLNQKFDVITPTQKGFYMVVVSGQDIKQIKRLYIR